MTSFFPSFPMNRPCKDDSLPNDDALVIFGDRSRAREYADTWWKKERMRERKRKDFFDVSQMGANMGKHGWRTAFLRLLILSGRGERNWSTPGKHPAKMSERLNLARWWWWLFQDCSSPEKKRFRKHFYGRYDRYLASNAIPLLLNYSCPRKAHFYKVCFMHFLYLIWEL